MNTWNYSTNKYSEDESLWKVDKRLENMEQGLNNGRYVSAYCFNEHVSYFVSLENNKNNVYYLLLQLIYKHYGKQIEDSGIHITWFKYL